MEVKAGTSLMWVKRGDLKVEELQVKEITLKLMGVDYKPQVVFSDDRMLPLESVTHLLNIAHEMYPKDYFERHQITIMAYHAKRKEQREHTLKPR